MTKTEIAKQKIKNATDMLRHDVAWQHYKGGIYKISSLAIDTDDGDVRVIYYRVAGPDFDAEAEYGLSYARPLREWFDNIEGQPRFRVTEWAPA